MLKWLFLVLPILANAEPLGALNLTVTQASIKQTVCVSGWTSTIRPPASYTNNLKKTQLAWYQPMSSYEEDHFIPLELGGNPKDPANLWAQPWNGSCNAHDKDRVENILRKQVCSGTITLLEAQAKIHIWRTVYSQSFGGSC